MEPTEHNRRAWNEAHRQRAEAAAGRLGIPPLVRERLPGLVAKHVLHLQCGTGESSAELAELGAFVTAVDISADALAVARERAPEIAWVQADVHNLPLELRRGRFHLVYASRGLDRIHDLDAWAGGISAALRAGGFLILHDEHPAHACLDDALRWGDDYFDSRDGRWRLGQVVTALAQTGLAIRRLEEFPSFGARRVPGEFILVARR